MTQELVGAKLIGLVVHIVESKTDRAAEGQLVQIAARESEAETYLCPVRTVRFLFGLRRQGQAHVFAEARENLNPAGLSESTIRSRLKDYLAVFMPAEKVRRLGSHSLRKGGATAAVQAGVPIRLIKLQGRWKSDAVFLYTLVSDDEALAVSNMVLQKFSDLSK